MAGPWHTKGKTYLIQRPGLPIKIRTAINREFPDLADASWE